MSVRFRFIVIEGGEGSGKSTQVQLLGEALRRLGEEVVLTFEPGDTPAGKAIRNVLLDTPAGLTGVTELFLFCADRAQHVAEVIRPALAAGKVVVSDRYEVSTWVYQGYAGGIGVEEVERLNELATGGLHADLTIILDIDPVAGLARTGRLSERERKQARRRRAVVPQAALPHLISDRLEARELEYHRLVRDGYLAWAQAHPDV
ncbi:MAG: dTMP kinase, partial [Armatimonadetes bacterium]|nr:dTMP kinase [Armatimonadota bacterium]